MYVRRVISCAAALLLFVAAGAMAATIDVSQPVKVTDSTYYERGQSIVYDGSNYWLFYGRSATCADPYSSGNPDIHDYAIYYKKAATVPGLAAATAVAVPGATNCYLGETGAALVDGNVWTFGTVPSVSFPGARSLYGWYSNDGGTSWTQVADLWDDMPNGAAHHDETGFDSNGKLYIMANYPESYAGWYTKWTDDPTAGSITWSTPIPLNTTTNHVNGTGHFYVEGTGLYIGLMRTSPSQVNYVLEYVASPEGWTELCNAASTAYDPTLFKVGSDYVYAQAPWVTPSQYIIAWSGSSLSTVLSGSSVPVTEGGYGTNGWVDMWPVGFTDAGSTSYLFYCSERKDPDAEGTGNIWYLEFDWDPSFDHYTYIQEAIDEALTGDTIDVAAGTYVEALLIDTPLTLLGATAGVNKNGYAVPASYAWDDTVESIISHPNPAGGYTTIVDIYDTDDVTFKGFVVQELNAVGNLNSSLVRVYAHTHAISNIVVDNNVIGPNTNVVSQDGAQGRMGLYIVNHPYSDQGVTNSSFSGNKIFDCKGNGNNIFLWSSYYAYGAPGPASMSGTVIDDNEIYGSHRSGIETAGGFSDLTISNNEIYGNSGLPGDDPDKLKYGHGILLIRGSSDKVSDPLTAFGPVDLSIHRNDIHDNEKSGIYMGPKNDGISITENFIHDNGWNGVVVDLVGNYWNPQFEAPPTSEQYACYDCSNDVAASGNSIYDNGGAGNPIAEFAVEVGGTPTNGFILDASANWYGVTTASGVDDLVEGDVDYTPWLDDGTDTSSDPGFQGDFSTLWVDDDSPQTGSDGRVEEGIKLVTASTVNVLPGTYVEVGQIVIDKDVSVVGDPSDRAVIKTDSDTAASGDARAWWLVEAGYSLTLENLVLDGTGHLIYQGIRALGGGTMNNCDMKNILYNESGPHYSGVGLVFFGTQNWTITDNTLENIGRIGIFGFGAGITGSTISGNTYTGKGVGNWLDYGIELGGGAVATITGNTVTECRGVASSDGSTSAGVLITTFWGPGTAGTLTSNSFTDNTTGIYVGYDGSDTAVVTAHYNDLSGNDDYGVYATSTTVVTDALSNWWGDATGPQHGTLNPGGLGVDVSDYVLFDPWIGKAGGENIVCDPDPLQLNVAGPSGQIAVKYLGGGGGLVYGYSVKFTWDSGVATTAYGDVTQGSLLSDAGTTQFFAYSSGTDEITIDCALLGAAAGVTGPGTMFTIDFDAAAFGTSPVDITLIAFRDNANNPLSGFYEDDGEIQVDITNPVVTNVAIENLTLTHTDEYAKNTDYLELTATVTDDYALTAADIVANLSTLLAAGGSAVVAEDYTSNVATWTLALANVSLTADGLKTVTVTATDGLLNSGSDDDEITVDNTPPEKVTGFAAAPAHEEGILSWTDPTSPSLDTNYYGIVVRYTAWGDYPYYDLGAPAYPADHTSGDGEAFDDLGAVTGGVHAIVPRDIHYYSAFAYDWALNYGTVDAGGQDRCTNYWLGDVASLWATWGYNGLVNVNDIDKLGGTYGAPPVGFNNSECDVGPTHDNSRVGIPEPDDSIQFEDLMIFAMNFGVVAPRVVPFLPDESTKALSLELAELGAIEDGMFEVAVRLEGNASEVKGLSTVIAYGSSELEFVSARLSADMSSPLAPVFFWHGSDGSSVQVDLAVLGTDVTIGGSGEVAVMTFRVLSDEYTLAFESADLRGADNEALSAEFDGLESRPETPVAYRLVGNLPNPFNPMTKVAYQVPHESHVSIRVYDVSGRLVRTLVDGSMDPGHHEVAWDGRNDRGEHVGSGVYFCTMEADAFHGSHKMMLLK